MKQYLLQNNAETIYVSQKADYRLHGKNGIGKLLTRYSVVVILFFIGCASTGEIDKSYQAVDYVNGINMDEAKAIAQKQLSRTNVYKDYDVNAPVFVSQYIVRDYPKYWFVEFKARKFERTFWSYLVVINKDTGNIQFADPYIPLEVTNYDWVFKKRRRK